MAIHKIASNRVESVATTFANSVDAFNANNWDEYKKYLDRNAVAYNISVLGYTIGRDEIADYFKSISDPNDPENLQFVPTNIIRWFPSVYPLSVRGVALWTHRAHGHVRAPIRYEFQFAPGDDHLLTAVWSQHSGNGLFDLMPP
jgi:hypothetical protein